MKITLIQVEKTTNDYLNEGISNYIKRTNYYISFNIVTINVPKNVRQRSISEQKAEEAKLILKEVDPTDYIVVLDELGKHYTSQAFAAFISKKMGESIKHLVFVIGGPYGFDETVYKRTNQQIALSTMTFSHQMVRLFFTEQVYRAFTIINNEKYHH